MWRHSTACILVIFLFIAGCQQDPADRTDRASATILQAPAVRQPGAYRQDQQAFKPLPPRPGHAQAAPQPQYTPHPAYAGVPKSWLPAASPRPWKWIVIHHSDTTLGSAASFDRYHREVHHWQSLGYDFVIDNGRGETDGLVEVGPRWTRQETGAHAGVLEYNEYGIGICLVGDFQTGRPTAAQLRSLARLNAFLMRAYHIPLDRIIGHRDAKKTNCPGRNLTIATVRAMASQYAAGKGRLLDGSIALGQ